MNTKNTTAVLEFPKVEGEGARHIQTQQIKDCIRASQFYRHFNNNREKVENQIGMLRAHFNRINIDFKITKEQLHALGYTREDGGEQTGAEDLRAVIRNIDWFVNNCDFLLVMLTSPHTKL